MKRLSIALVAFTLTPLMAFAETATMYRSLHCGCCLGHAEYLESLGFDVKVVSVEPERLASYKAEQNIPEGVQSCHTIKIDGYLIEGHVPAEAIEKLLAERPDIRGIALPGMPMGSPGMNGNKTGPFKVMKIGGDGGVFMEV